MRVSQLLRAGGEVWRGSVTQPPYTGADSVACVTHHQRLPLALGLLVALAACGDDHTAHPAADTATPGSGEPRVVEIVMDDIRFDPTTLEVARGETVKFRFTNQGAIPHDAFIGDAAAQTEHEEEMAAMSGSTMAGMDHAGHSDNAITVGPGDTQTLTYTFDEAGQIEIGCHQPGHYAAGMRIDIEVG